LIQYFSFFQSFLTPTFYLTDSKEKKTKTTMDSGKTDFFPLCHDSAKFVKYFLNIFKTGFLNCCFVTFVLPSSGQILTINYKLYGLCQIKPLDGGMYVTKKQLIFGFTPSSCQDIYSTLYFIYVSLCFWLYKNCSGSRLMWSFRAQPKWYQVNTIQYLTLICNWTVITLRGWLR